MFPSAATTAEVRQRAVPDGGGPRFYSPAVRHSSAPCAVRSGSGIHTPPQPARRPARLCGGGRQTGVPKMCRWTGRSKTLRDKGRWPLTRPPARKHRPATRVGEISEGGRFPDFWLLQVVETRRFRPETAWTEAFLRWLYQVVRAYLEV